jgi:outer membrane protein assembly factor BamE
MTDLVNKLAALSGLRRLAVAALVVALLAGCVHRIDIQQGNFLDTEDIDRIAVGMTRVQVRSLLGTPMVADPFQNTRWDYVYYLKKGRWQKPQQRHFIVFFDSTDKVAKIDRPTAPPKS